jgi:hypothetical protein
MAQIQQEIDNIIAANIPIQIIEMERKKAEELYTKSPVNHTFIYDKYPIPESVTELRICLINGVNVNCCGGNHLNTTGELQKLLVIKSKNRSKKKEYEFEFVCHDGATEYLARQVAALEKLHASKTKLKPTADSNGASNNTASKETVAPTTIDPMTAAELAAAKASPMFSQWRASTPTASARAAGEHISAIILPHFSSLLNPETLKTHGINDLSKLQEALTDVNHPFHKKILESLVPRLDRRLTIYGNECYTDGFAAGKSSGK